MAPAVKVSFPRAGNMRPPALQGRGIPAANRVSGQAFKASCFGFGGSPTPFTVMASIA
jgi:hypothetical protein